MININVINFWYTNVILEKYDSWLLFSVFNLNKFEFNNLRLNIKSNYNSNLYLISNKHLVNFFINLNIYNRSTIILSIKKNLYFFSNKLLKSFNNIFVDYKKYIKFLGYFNYNKFIASFILNKYVNSTVFSMYFFFSNIFNILFFFKNFFFLFMKKLYNLYFLNFNSINILINNSLRNYIYLF